MDSKLAGNKWTDGRPRLARGELDIVLTEDSDDTEQPEEETRSQSIEQRLEIEGLIPRHEQSRLLLELPYRFGLLLCSRSNYSCFMSSVGLFLASLDVYYTCTHLLLSAVNLRRLSLDHVACTLRLLLGLMCVAVGSDEHNSIPRTFKSDFMSSVESNTTRISCIFHASTI